MARLFYHKPQFAILDECTSAVSVDVEDYIYSHCREVSVIFCPCSHFTVSNQISIQEKIPSYEVTKLLSKEGILL